LRESGSAEWEILTMSNQSGPEEIRWDDPPYHLAKACQQLGFHAPLDVRWCRMSQVLAGLWERPGTPGTKVGTWFFNASQPSEPACTCGRPLPALEKCTFTFTSGKTAHYLLGQCRRCRTMFWDEASQQP
jgi:hypothetical protein